MQEKVYEVELLDPLPLDLYLPGVKVFIRLNGVKTLVGLKEPAEVDQALGLVKLVFYMACSTRGYELDRLHGLAVILKEELIGAH